MKKYLRKKAVELMAAVYLITAFLTPVDTVLATEREAVSGAGIESGESGNSLREPETKPEKETEKSGEKEPGEKEPGEKEPGVNKGAVPVSDDSWGSISDDTPVMVHENDEEEEASGDRVPAPSVSGTEMASSGRKTPGEAGDGPNLLSLMITLYKPDKPNESYTKHEYIGFVNFRYNAGLNREVPFSEKYVSEFIEVRGKVSETSIDFRLDTDRVQCEVEELDQETQEVLSTTGRVSQTSFRFDHFGLFRLHLYPLYEVGDADEEDIMYYFYSAGVDNVPPVINPVLNTEGTGHADKEGKMRYGSARLDLNASDEHTALAEKPYMTDYPDGEWTSQGYIEKAESKIYTIGVRDIKNNIRVVNVDATCIDDRAPVFSGVKMDDRDFFNGFALKEEVEIEADDETELAGKYYSVNSSDWSDKSVMSITCNGTYPFYLRDVFRNTGSYELEIDNIDTEPPTAHFSDEPDSRVKGYSSKHELKINARDDKAGFDEKPYSFDGGKTWVKNDSLVTRENGVYELCVRDGLKNMAGPVRFEVKDIDNKAPEIISVSEDRKQKAGEYAAYSMVCVSAKDSESGLAEKFVSFDDGLTWTNDPVKRVDKNGSLKIRVKDGTGNEASVSVNVADLDTVPPECEVTGNPTNLTKNKVVLKLHLSDELSGLKSVFVENGKAGIKKEIKAYDPDDLGTGKIYDTVDVDITSNGEYIFTVTDMCHNSVSERVVVSKIIKPAQIPQTGDPTDEPDPVTKDPQKEKDKKSDDGNDGNKTVVIGRPSGSTPQNNTKDSTITVRSTPQSTVSEGGTIKITASSNRSKSGLGPEESEEDEVSDNSLKEEEYEPPLEDFSSEFYDTELPEYQSSNEPRELEALPNPDEVEETETHSHAGVIAGTVFAIVLALSALTFYLLIKKGIIKKPDFLGGSDEG